MNDDLLYALNQQPNAAFADTLRERLRQQAIAAPQRAWPLRTFSMAAAIVIVVAALSSMPGVRAYAQSFLAMFRVVNFVAVPVASRSASVLTGEQLDLPRLLGNQIQMIQQGGAPVAVSSVEGAGSSAGFTVAQPAFVPPGATLDQILLSGASAARTTIDVTTLDDILQALGINDLAVPPEVNGQTMTLRVSPIVQLSYTIGTRWAHLLQARPPQVEMPASLDLQRLGEIALRVLGMPATDARTFAQQIDWHTTLLLPIPPNATRFQQVDINGHMGVQVETDTPSGARRTIVFWSTGDRVFVLEGTIASRDVMQMALSVR